MEVIKLNIDFEIPYKSTMMIQALLGLEALKGHFGEGVVERAIEAYILLNEVRECRLKNEN